MKRLFATSHDVMMAALAAFLALGFRYGFDSLPPTDQVVLSVAVFAGLALFIFPALGLGRGMWRFASLADLRTILIASALVVLAFLLGMFLINRLDAIPRSVPVVAWFILVVLLGAPRLAYRIWKGGGLESLRAIGKAQKFDTLLMVGSVADCDKAIRTYGLESARRYRVRGIIDYTAQKAGRQVRGIPVIGSVDELPEIIDRLLQGGTTIDTLLLATPRHHRAQLRRVTTLAAQLKIPLRRIAAPALGTNEPNLEDITLEDLLGRDPVRLELEKIRHLIEGHVVLVTGAGGSIGSEIARQVASHSPSRLIIVDQSEYGLYEIDRELAGRFPSTSRVPILASIRDRARIEALFHAERPAVVFHAAALKHVPLVEANVCEGVLTNVAGTRNVADAAIQANVETFVMISTDKAIRPTSVMGATKRAAEAYCQALDTSGARTRFITVRFGNVLGSTGSVVPLFKQQIQSGGPVTVTDPEMKRYFMTIQEATELVLQAAAAGAEREDQRGRIMVLDMGEPVKIVDLARTMIALAGRRPDHDIAITYTGLRPGEKLFEELFDPDERTVPTEADGVFAASARVIDLASLENMLANLEATALSGDDARSRQLLARIVPELPHDKPGFPLAEAVRKSFIAETPASVH